MHCFPKVQRNSFCQTFLSTFLVLLFVRVCGLYVPLHFTIRQWKATPQSLSWEQPCQPSVKPTVPPSSLSQINPLSSLPPAGIWPFVNWGICSCHQSADCAKCNTPKTGGQGQGQGQGQARPGLEKSTVGIVDCLEAWPALSSRAGTWGQERVGQHREGKEMVGQSKVRAG